MTPSEFRAARKQLGLTQAALAEVMCCHVHHISNVEQGLRKPSGMLCAFLKLLVETRLTGA